MTDSPLGFGARVNGSLGFCGTWRVVFGWSSCGDQRPETRDWGLGLATRFVNFLIFLFSTNCFKIYAK